MNACDFANLARLCVVRIRTVPTRRHGRNEQLSGERHFQNLPLFTLYTTINVIENAKIDGPGLRLYAMAPFGPDDATTCSRRRE